MEPYMTTEGRDEAMKHEMPMIPFSDLTEADERAGQLDCDLETICRAKDGDQNAFSLLFMRTYRQMYFVVRNYLSRDEDVYDALQNGYLKAYKYLNRLDPPEMFLPWLTKIMHNAAKDVRGQMQGYSVGDDIQEIADVDHTPDVERRADIKSVLAQMDPKRAKVLTLYYYDGMKLSDIARLLGEPASTVRSRFKAAKKEILELLKTKDIDSSLYSGSISAMITVALRSVIGTDILSAVTAQQMLDGILDDSKLNKAAFRLVEQRRNRSVRHLAMVLLLVCAGVAALAAAVVIALSNGKNIQVNLPWIPSSSSVETTTTLNSMSGIFDGGSTQSTENTAQTEDGTTIPTNDGSSTESSSTTATTDDEEQQGTGGTVSTATSTSKTTWIAPIFGTSSTTKSGGGITVTIRNTATTTKHTTTSTKPKSSKTTTTTKLPSSSTTTTTTKSSATTTTTKAFVSDYREGHANTFGNSSNNLFSNKGQIAKQDQWLYYVKNGKEVWKVKTDGTHNQCILQQTRYSFTQLNVVGDWIYLRRVDDLIPDSRRDRLMRFRTDGSQSQIDTSRNVDGVQVIGDQLYYCDTNSLYVDYDNCGVLRGTISPDVSLENVKYERISEYHNADAFWTNGEYLVFRHPSVVNDVYPEALRSMSLLSEWRFPPMFYTRAKTEVLTDGYTIYTIKHTGELTDYGMARQFSVQWGPMRTICTGMPTDINLCYVMDGKIAITAAEKIGSVTLIDITTGEGEDSHWPDGIDVQNMCTFDDGYVYTFTQDGALCRAKADGSNFKRLT